jgi:hypothetical protein
VSYVRHAPPSSVFAAGLRRVLDRGGAVVAMYSGSSLRLINHARQMDKALGPFGLAGRVPCVLWPETNHTFTGLSAQTRLLDAIGVWAAELSARRGVAGPGAPRAPAPSLSR